MRCKLGYLKPIVGHGAYFHTNRQIGYIRLDIPERQPYPQKPPKRKLPALRVKLDVLPSQKPKFRVLQGKVRFRQHQRDHQRFLS